MQDNKLLITKYHYDLTLPWFSWRPPSCQKQPSPCATCSEFSAPFRGIPRDSASLGLPERSFWWGILQRGISSRETGCPNAREGLTAEIYLRQKWRMLQIKMELCGYARAYIEKATDFCKRPDKSLARKGNLIGEAVELPNCVQIEVRKVQNCTSPD